jgi:hypothetical protein
MLAQISRFSAAFAVSLQLLTIAHGGGYLRADADQRC